MQVMQETNKTIEEINTYMLANRIMILELARMYIKNEKQLLEWTNDCDKKAEELLKKKSIDKKKR